MWSGGGANKSRKSERHTNMRSGSNRWQRIPSVQKRRHNGGNVKRAPK